MGCSRTRSLALYSEEFNIDSLFDRLEPVLNRLNITCEIVGVNDGSKDSTLGGLLERHRRTPAIGEVGLSRSFGKEVALTAGINCASGKTVVPAGADLQDPRELIEGLVAEWREGYGAVCATRLSRQGESWRKR